jgi:YbbR domain-containing protein
VTEVLEPRMFRAELRAKVRRSVRVEPVLAGSPPDGFTVVGNPRVSPEEVEIVGPADLVGAVQSLHLYDLDLSKVRGMVVTKRGVDLGSLPRVAASPTEVEVIVTVEPIAEARFPAVPVRVETGRRGVRATVAPSTVSVLVSGPSSVVSLLRGEALALTIDGSDVPAGSYSYRTDIVGVNRVALMPVSSPGAGGVPGADAPHRAATLTLPPEVQVVEIVPSYFSLVIERGSGRARASN